MPVISTWRADIWRKCRALPAPVVEAAVGAAVIAVAALSVVFAYRSSGITAVEGYTLTARFEHVEGIRLGSDVHLSGIKVGTVVAEALEPGTYFALLTLSIDKDVKLPTDTTAKIVTGGFLGNKYVDLQPGAEEKLLGPGGRITHTQSAINLEDLLSRYIFQKSDGRAEGAARRGGNAHDR